MHLKIIKSFLIIQTAINSQNFSHLIIFEKAIFRNEHKRNMYSPAMMNVPLIHKKVIVQANPEPNNIDSRGVTCYPYIYTHQKSDSSLQMAALLCIIPSQNNPNRSFTHSE